jgi:hypothetical protein
MGLKLPAHLKLSVNYPKRFVATCALGPWYGKVLGYKGDLLHLVGMEELPANVFTRLAATTYLVGPEG